MSTRNYTVELTAGESKRFPVNGTVFHVKNAGGTFDVTIDDQDTIPCELGLGFETDKPFSTIGIKNTSASTQTVEFYAGFDKVNDGRLVGIVNITGGLETKENNDTDYAYDSTVSITTSELEIFAEDALRKKGIIKNKSGGTIYVGKTGLSTANGFPVGNNEVFEWSEKPALFAIAGSTLNVFTFEITYQ